MGLPSVFGNTLSSIGQHLGLPDLGLGKAIGGNTSLPGALQGVSPTLYQGIAGVIHNNNPIQNLSAADTASIPGFSGNVPAPQVLGSSTGGGAPAPDLSQYKNDVQSRISQLQGLYNQMFGTVDQNVADQRNTYDQGYNTQQGQLNNDYQSSLGQIGQIYAGRGLADSSYLGDAQGQATNTYNSNLDSLNQNRDAAYSNLGKFAQTEKQQLGAGQAGLGQIDLSQYTDPNQLMSLRNQLDQQLGTLQSTQAGLGTNAQYQGALQAATPAATQAGSAQLAAQLQKLKASGASPLVTNQIAQGLIKSAGKNNDPYIQNLWSSLNA